MVKKDEKYVIPASMLKRILAFTIDLFILNIIVAAPFSGLLDKMGLVDMSFSALQNAMNNSSMMSTLNTMFFFITSISIFYFAVLESRFGQSVGMMILNIYAIKIPKQNIAFEVLKDKEKSVKSMATSTNARNTTMGMKTASMKQKNTLGEMRGVKEMNMTFLDAVLRNLELIPIVILWVIDPLVMLFTKNSQRFMEIISGTMTVELVGYDERSRWL